MPISPERLPRYEELRRQTFVFDPILVEKLIAEQTGSIFYVVHYDKHTKDAYCFCTSTFDEDCFGIINIEQYEGYKSTLTSDSSFIEKPFLKEFPDKRDLLEDRAQKMDINANYPWEEMVSRSAWEEFESMLEAQEIKEKQYQKNEVSIDNPDFDLSF